MKFIQIDRNVKEKDWSMPDLHSHTHYELYFLLKGNRLIFLENALYKMSAPMILIIPPHVLHKTEGNAFERYNINVSPESLDPFQKYILQSKALRAVKLSSSQALEFTKLLETAYAVDERQKFGEYQRRALFSYAMFLISNFEETPLPTTTLDKENVTPLVLKAIDYLHSHYGEKITLDDLSKLFFVAKPTLIYNFKKYTGCSPIDFLLNVRLTKAKELLSDTNKSVNEIAECCGFSSANYFGLIFKKKEGLSPIGYRKIQRSKQ
ncbi:MAG: helix-turn-helix domain-containing protein [Clostridia bacterium]|nr:helix-turn-helix domain-containing protein [Clostridia bacterium]